MIELPTWQFIAIIIFAMIVGYSIARDREIARGKIRRAKMLKRMNR